MTHLLEVVHQYWNTLWQFMNDHSFLFDGLLSPLFMAILASIGAGVAWLWRRKQRPRGSITAADTFPFEIIKPNSNTVLQMLLGSANDRPDDPLADFNIPYQQREAERNVQKELYEHLNEKGWVLILGKSGFGKSREAAQLAQRLSQEGWTILTFKWWEWEALGSPSRLPIEQIGTDRRLLFFLDDLNKPFGMNYRSRESADDPTKLAIAPMQERLLQTLEAYERGCRQENIRVIATARNESIPEREGEPSELEKLDLERFPILRDRFVQYELSEPESGALVELLQQTVPLAEVQAEAQDYIPLVARSDRTFRILVNNLRQAKRENATLTQVFKPTLRGSWEKRYQDAKQKYGAAPDIYAAVGLLRSVGVELRFFTVAPTARMIAQRHHPIWLWRHWQIDRALRYLIAAEDILDPSDGQIEASGRGVEVGEYIQSLLNLLLKLTNRHSSDLLFSLRNFGIAAYNLHCYPQALRSINKVVQLSLPSEQSRVEPKADPERVRFLQDFLGEIWFYKGNILYQSHEHKEEAIASYDQAIQFKADLHEAWNNRGNALSDLGRKEEAIASYDQAIQFKANYLGAWYNRGLALSDLGRKEEAIASYDQAIEFKADYHEAWYNRGNALFAIGRHEEAIASYDQAIQFKADKHAAWNNRGVCLKSLGRYEEAISSYDKSLEFLPEDAGACYNAGVYYNNVARCYGLQGNVERAIEFLGRAIELDPKYREDAKTDTDFDGIRESDAFQALMEGL